MTHPAMNRILIEGFLSIRSARIKLRRLNALVGANGAGKSNIVRVFEFLARLADSELALFVGLNGGASTLLHDREQQIRLVVDAGDVTYQALLIAGANDELIFGLESVADREIRAEFGNGNKEGYLAQTRDQRWFPLRNLFAGCRVYHFHDTSRNAPVKQYVPTADNVVLRADAGNLAAVLLDLQNADSPAYRRIVGAVQQVAPFFRDFVLRPENNDRVRLRWRQVDSDTVFSAHQMSDGMLRYACLATLLLQPELPALVVLDEPELGLHPFAIMQLADLLRQASTRSQVLFATQSVTLISQFELDDVIVAERRDGASFFSRPDPERLAEWLTDYSLGELWEKNLLGGGPRPETRRVDG